jgi:hypothetical protein
MSGGLDMFINDLPSLQDVFKMPNLLEDAYKYTYDDGTPIVNENNSTDDEPYFYSDYLELEAIKRKTDPSNYGIIDYDENIDADKVLEYNNNSNVEKDYIEQIFDEDTIKAMEESIKDLE